MILGEDFCICASLMIWSYVLNWVFDPPLTLPPTILGVAVLWSGSVMGDWLVDDEDGGKRAEVSLSFDNTSAPGESTAMVAGKMF